MVCYNLQATIIPNLGNLMRLLYNLEIVSVGCYMNWKY
jgi:hypothetical protein